MAQISLVSKTLAASFNKSIHIAFCNAILLLFSVSAVADGDNDHTHAHGEGDHGMQVLGIVIILVLAGGVIWFLSKKKK